VTTSTYTNRGWPATVTDPMGTASAYKYETWGVWGDGR
jgi:hypothetical protein